MILRYDRVGIELPEGGPDAGGAIAVQELIGGRFGEMSTLMNYTFQSFNFRDRTPLRPFFDLIANIAAEEYGHIELVGCDRSTRCSPAPTVATSSRPATPTTCSRAARARSPSTRSGRRGRATTCSPPATSSRT